jgi:hypothetical protein
MLKAVMSDGELTFESSVRGIAIYLDMFALKSFAKGDATLRQRFVAAINNGADLLFFNYQCSGNQRSHRYVVPSSKGHF